MKVFDEITVLPARNGIVVRKRVPDGNALNSSNMHVFNKLEDFYDWFQTYAMDGPEDEGIGASGRQGTGTI